jgi:hypothetical protein
MASTQGLVGWGCNWVGFCDKAMGVTGVMIIFSDKGPE